MAKNPSQNAKKSKPGWARLLVVNDPYPMRIYAGLAEEIGLGESILLLQIEYLIATSTTEEHDGDLWTYQSLEDLKHYCRWWSVPTISRMINNLAEKKYIKIGNYNKKGWDRTCWYALNPEGINTLKSIKIDASIFQNEKCNRASCADASAQNEKCNRATCAHASAQVETTLPQTPTQINAQTPTETSSSSSELRSDENPSQEEEGPTNKYFSDGFTGRLIKAGVFDSKINAAEAIAEKGGWTESQMERLLDKCIEQDRDGTPGALFLYRLAHRRPPKEKTIEIPDQSPTVGDSEIDEHATSVWNIAKLELVKRMDKLFFNTWFSNGAIEAWIDDDHNFILAAANDGVISAAEKYSDNITSILKSLEPGMKALVIE